jgi:Zn-dependent alcohol dehydrogenase
MCISGRENLCVKATSARMKGVLLDGTTRLRLSDGRPLHIG